MKISKNKQVQKFLNDIRDSDDEKYLILQKCREIVFMLDNTIDERIIYGGIMFSRNNTDFGGIFPASKHISFEFGQGYRFNDEKDLLEGKGKYRRHLKLRIFADIKVKQIEYFISQAMQFIS